MHNRHFNPLFFESYHVSYILLKTDKKGEDYCWCCTGSRNSKAGKEKSREPSPITLLHLQTQSESHFFKRFRWEKRGNVQGWQTYTWGVRRSWQQFAFFIWTLLLLSIGHDTWNLNYPYFSSKKGYSGAQVWLGSCGSETLSGVMNVT